MAYRFIIFLLLFPLLIRAQENIPVTPSTPINGILVRTTIYQGDTIPYATLPTVTCGADRVFKNKKEKAKWDRLKYNVKKVYPYAILA
nr:DUF4294 domain-containing protein [Bacteroidota bacterium]